MLGWRTFAPDLQPGAEGVAATGFDDYLAQVRAWHAVAGSPCVTIGASLGGLLALAAAATVDPAGLVVINPLPPAGIDPRPAPREYPGIVAWGRERSLTGTRRALSDADDAACLFAFRRWRDESGAVLRAAADGIAIEAPRCPLLVLASEHDGDVPPAASRALAAKYAADFRLLAGVSHVGPLLGRRAAVVADDVRRWCEAALATRRTRLVCATHIG